VIQDFFRLQGWLSQLNWDSQQGRLRTTSILVRAIWNFKLKVLKYSRNCSLHNTLIPNLVKLLIECYYWYTLHCTWPVKLASRIWIDRSQITNIQFAWLKSVPKCVINVTRSNNHVRSTTCFSGRIHAISSCRPYELTWVELLTKVELSKSIRGITKYSFVRS
jgi:hypothetical protein